jgi:hypothetical protein
VIRRCDVICLITGSDKLIAFKRHNGRFRA